MVTAVGMAIVIGVAIVAGAVIATGAMIAAGIVAIGAAPIMAGVTRAAGLNGAGTTACASAAEAMTAFLGGCCGGRPSSSVACDHPLQGAPIATLYNVLYK